MAGWSDQRPPLPPDWAARRRAVLRRDENRCRLRYECCTVKATEVDHIYSNTNHSLTNLRAVCAPCHMTRTREQARTAFRAAWAQTRPRQPPHPGLM